MINNFSKKIAFSALKMIKYGKIIVTDYDQSKHIFGNDENLIVFVKINRSDFFKNCLLYTSPSPRDKSSSRMPSSA